jgi:hypothetical protein
MVRFPLVYDSPPSFLLFCLICSYRPATFVTYCSEFSVIALRVETIRAEFYNRVLIDNQEQTAINQCEVFRVGDEFRTGRDIARTEMRRGRSPKRSPRHAHAHQFPGTARLNLPYLELRRNKTRNKRTDHRQTAEPPIMRQASSSKSIHFFFGGQWRSYQQTKICACYTLSTSP